MNICVPPHWCYRLFILCVLTGWPDSGRRTKRACMTIDTNKQGIYIAAVDWYYRHNGRAVVRYILEKIHILSIHFTPLRVVFVLLMLFWCVLRFVWPYWSECRRKNAFEKYTDKIRMRECEKTEEKNKTINAGVNLSLVSVVFKCVGTSSSHTIIVSPALLPWVVVWCCDVALSLRLVCTRICSFIVFSSSFQSDFEPKSGHAEHWAK